MKTKNVVQVHPQKKGKLIGLYPVNNYHKQAYEIQYMHRKVTLHFNNLEQVILHVFEKELHNRFECVSITLPGGNILQWNPYVANAFVSKGRITEEQFIGMCEIKTREVANG